MNRKHLLGIGLLTAAMLLTGCSAEILDGHSGQVPIYLTASVQEGGAQGVTRAGTDVQSTQLPENETFYGYFPSGATVSSATFTANGSGGTTADPQPYFTFSGTETTVHAYHGKSGGTAQVTNETTSFSVATDQSSDAAYRASDLMYATATVTKSGLSATGELTFSHKMAKIIVNATMGSGITSITAVKIVGGSKTINIATPQSCTLGSTLSGDNSSANITVFSGSHTAGTLSCAALIPPQRVPATGSTATNFLQIVTNAGTVTYSLNGKQFDSNNVYTFNVTLTASQAGTTVAITDWADNGNVEVIVGGDDPAAMLTGDNTAIARNPLYWVAQYNVKTIKGVTDPATSEAATATAFYTYHAVPGNVFMFADAGKLAASSTENENYDATAERADYHLPNRDEQVSIIPSQVSTGSGANIFAQDCTSADSPYIMDQIACNVGGNSVGSCKSYFLKVAALDYYAVRFVSSDANINKYASAWHYKMVPGSGLTIESYMLATKPTTDAQANEILAALPFSPAWEGTANEAPTTASPTAASSLVRRFMPASGWEGGSSGVADHEIGIGASCVSATKDGSNCFLWRIASVGGLDEYSSVQTNGRSVRLFRNDFDDPGVALASATVGMIVGSNGKAYNVSDKDNMPSGVSAVAVVGYKNGTSGYALALVDAAQDTWDNITNSGANKNVDCTLADGKRGSVPAAPAGTTWKVLTKDHYSAMWQAMGSTKNRDGYTYDATSNKLITDAGGTALSGGYWSSQEESDYGFEGFGWGFGILDWASYSKTDSRSIRPVLAW